MKKLLIKSVVCLIVVILFDRSMGAFLDHKYESNVFISSNGGVTNYLKRERPDTLFVGSSRISCHVDTRMLHVSNYNLSEPAKHEHYFVGVIDLLARKDQLPRKRLVLHIDPTSLDASKQEELCSEIASLRYYYDQSPFIREKINALGPFECMNYWSRLYRHNGNAMKLMFGEIENTGVRVDQKYGFYPLQKNAEMSILRIDDEGTHDRISVETSNLREGLRHVKAICDKNGIDLVCITAPRRTRDSNYYLLSAEMEKLLKKEGITYINYTRPGFTDDYFKEYWFDELHLTEEGAKRFTQLLRKDLRAME